MQPDKGKAIRSVISSDLKSKQSNIAANVNFEHQLSSSRQIKLIYSFIGEKGNKALVISLSQQINL